MIHLDDFLLLCLNLSYVHNKTPMFPRNFGRLARIVEAQKEGLADLAWHPTRPVVTSVSMSGVIYFWAKDYTENWSA